MDALPFGRPGRFYKGNLHTHSTNSDGLYPPEEVIRRYREAGYDFLALSDHFMDDYDFPVTDTRHLRSDDFTTIVSAELHVGHTRVKELWHILAIGIPADFQRPHADETAPEIAKRAADAGAFVGIVHPGWYGLTTDDAKEITSAHAIEIYNHGSAYEVDRGEDWPFCDQLLNEGWKLSGFATDDAHQLTHDWLGGWTMVHADDLDPDKLVESLKAGRYYSSQGPELHNVAIDGDEIVVECSPASVISATGKGSRSETKLGDGMTECRLPLHRFDDGYVRVTVRDAGNRKAWTNPIWLN